MVGITPPIERVVTDNGACYRADAFAQALLRRATSGSPPRTRPDTTGRWRYNRILAEEVVYARAWVSEDQRREALAIRNIHYDFHRPTAPLMENRLRRGYAKRQ